MVFLICWIGKQTHLNATVQWTVARFRLDGIGSLIYSIPLGSTEGTSLLRRRPFHITGGRVVQPFARLVKPGTMTGTVPGVFHRIPVKGTAQVRASGAGGPDQIDS